MGSENSKEEIYPSPISVASTTIASSNSITRKSDSVQNYLLIWVDVKIDRANEECKKTLTQLRDIISEVHLFKTPKECINFLKNMDDKKAFILSSGALGQQLVSDIHGMKQVEAIFISCTNPSLHTTWTKEWPKIEGIFTRVKQICESLATVLRECDHDTISMNLIPKSITAAIASNQQNLNQLIPSFMYSSLFKETILEINEDDTKMMKDLVVYAREKGISESQLQEFQQQYQRKTPIWWYTGENFLYGMLNYALRSLDMETITKMGFFIRNLQQQLKNLHGEQSISFRGQFIVYRGQKTSWEDFQNLFNTKNGFISFNNFLLTTTDRKDAMVSAQRALKCKENVGVIFIMNIDPKKVSSSTTPFALIDRCSFSRRDNEILFSMHTIFRIDNIKQTGNNSRIWEVHMTFVDENDPELNTLIRHMREELNESTGWDRMGRLMIHVGHFSQAEEVYKELLKTASNDNDKSNIFQQLGLIKRKQGEYKEAVLFYKNSIEIKQQTLSDNHSDLVNLYDNIALVYNEMGDYSEAFRFYRKSQSILENSTSDNPLKLASCYDNIAGVYQDMSNNQKALKYYEKALEIKEKNLSANHLDLAISYNTIGLVYDEIGDYPKAVEFLQKTLDIGQNSLPSAHPAIQRAIDNISYVKEKL